MAERSVLVDFETKENRTDPTSNYGWSKLSPGSQDKRRKKLVKSRCDLIHKVTKISDATSEGFFLMKTLSLCCFAISRCFFDRQTRRRIGSPNKQHRGK